MFSPSVFHIYSILQITGGVGGVRKALLSISQHLLENSTRDHESLTSSASGSSHPSGHLPPPNRSFGAQGVPYTAGTHDISDFHSAPPSLLPNFHEGVHGRIRPSQEMLTFRLLCHAERVGSIIGKGGVIIKSVKQETASEIKIIEGEPDSEDRIIVISGPAV